VSVAARNLDISLRTHHEVQVYIVDAQGLEGAGDTLFNTLVPRVVELGSDPDLLTRNATVLDTLTDLLLVAIGKSCVDVTVAGLERSLDSLADLTRL
jgi:hypothetical protein